VARRWPSNSAGITGLLEIPGRIINRAGKTGTNGQQTGDQRRDDILARPRGDNGIVSAGNGWTMIRRYLDDHLHVFRGPFRKQPLKPQEADDLSDRIPLLDEVGATPLSVQSRLLRVLQEHEVMRIGGDRLISVNVRVIAATNQNLCQEVQKGRFREDLYFRLDVITVHIPPLREQIADLPLLVQDLIRRCARNHKAQSLTIPEHHLKKLMELHWPGNVRQLQSFVEKLVILCEDGYQDDTFEELYANLLT
jgi:hypothetical protein